MQTLYIDVYFLINFTINLLSIYFASVFSKIQSTSARLIISSVISALFACFVILFQISGILLLLSIILTVILITLIFAKGTLVLRKVKFFISFLIFETFIGGLVNWFYGVLDRYVYKYFENVNFGAYNNKLLVLALLVLLSYAVLKILFTIFSGSRSEKNKKFTICIFGKKEEVTALIDSGNLLVDPMNGLPVIIVKKKMIGLFADYSDVLNTEDEEIKKRIRLIPAKGLGNSKIYTAIRCDSILVDGIETEYKNAVIALDEEEGSYGGYAALMPASVAIY